jgi:NAD(P)-dependent dehydrogenase (short-subunit alcohol dehydrogenase family)
MVQVRGQRVAITGGAQGIGRAIAQALIDAGCRVAIGDIQEAAVTQTATELGAHASGHRLDVTDASSFESFLDQATAALGGIDVLVNNAGIMPIGPFLAEDAGVIRRTIDIDLIGVLTGTRLAGTRFAERGSGHIVNIASVMGTLASPNAATYCAAKYAVVGFSAALRQEWRGNGVKVSAICPGFVRTDLIAGMSAPGLLESVSSSSTPRRSRPLWSRNSQRASRAPSSCRNRWAWSRGRRASSRRRSWTLRFACPAATK